MEFGLRATIQAQQTRASGAQRAEGYDTRIIDLRLDASAEEILEATKGFQQGHVVRIIGGSPADLRRLITANAVDTSVRTAGDNAPRMMAADRVAEVSAVHLGRHGELHQFTSTIVAGARDPSPGGWMARFEEWFTRQTTAVGDPGPPAHAWTQVLGVTDVQKGDWGSVQTVVNVYRLNGTDTSADYYMVLTDPTTAPNFIVAPRACASIFLAACGWYTAHRDITISTTPTSTLFDHGPTTTITNGAGSWTLGLTVPGPTASYSQSWSQASVTTTDQSNPGTGLAKWAEAFTEESAFSELPATSTSTFLSHQGVIFEVPPAASFQLNVNVVTQMIYQPAFGSEQDGGATFGLYTSISPPQFSVEPNSTTIAPGTGGNIQLIARIGDDKLGLPWAVSNIPSWLNVDQTSGARTSQLKLTVAEGTPLGTLGTLNFNTDPPFAAPSVTSGPLTMNVKVGQPNTHGALLIGGLHRENKQDVELATAVLYAADSNQFSGVSAMAQARSSHTSTLLQDGRILVAGGFSGNTRLATAELYDPATASFSPVHGASNCPGASGCMVTAANYRAATRLADGRVLITGGLGQDSSACFAAAEVFDPATLLFTAVPNMSSPRCYHTSTLLPNGEVLIAGGVTDASFLPLVTTAELFNPMTNSFRLTGSRVAPTYSARALLTGTTGLLAGGYGPNGVSDGAELYFPSAGTFSSIAKMNSPRVFHTATGLQNSAGS